MPYLGPSLQVIGILLNKLAYPQVPEMGSLAVFRKCFECARLGRARLFSKRLGPAADTATPTRAGQNSCIEDPSRIGPRSV